MANTLTSLSDRDLLIETQRAAASERQATASLIALLAEVDTRRLYLGLGFSSLFSYATERLRLSEPAAYSRITAARVTRRFPVVLSLLDEGLLSLTTLGLLAAHLTDENHEALLAAAKHKTKRDVERLVAAVHPQPDIPPSVRALPPARSMAPPPAPEACDATPVSAASAALLTHQATAAPLLAGSGAPRPIAESAGRPALVAPLAPGRYLIRMTVSEETREKLRQATDLLRHTIQDGDPSAVFDRALSVLLEQLLRAKAASGARPRSASRPLRGAAKSLRGAAKSLRGAAKSPRGAAKSPRGDAKPLRGAAKSPRVAAKSPRVAAKSPRVAAKSSRVAAKSRRAGVKSTPVGDKSRHVAPNSPRVAPKSRRVGAKSRHVPAPVRRAVWARDQGRCAFVGTAGRCKATGRLEFHHVVPYACSGPTTVENVQLRCRAHNAYEGELAFGDWRGRTSDTRGGRATPSGRSSVIGLLDQRRGESVRG